MPDLSISTVIVKLNPIVTNSIADTGWEITDPAHISAWIAADKTTSRANFETEDGLEYIVDVDLSPVINRLKANYEIMSRIYKNENIQDKAQDAQSLSIENILVTFQITHPDRRSGVESIIDYYLNDLFLIMNISAPASFSLYRTMIASEARFDHSLDLSNYNFDISWLSSFEGKWPTVNFIDFDKTFVWFFKVRGKFSLVPKNKMERVLFSVLHICRGELSPATIVWIFNALETLYDTKPGENFRILIERISLLLSASKDEKANLKKSMRKLYDIRSAFVHGGLDIIHPLHDEAIDKNVDDAYYRLLEAAEFGFQVLLASLQEIIVRGWVAPKFNEVIEDAGTLEA